MLEKTVLKRKAQRRTFQGGSVVTQRIPCTAWLHKFVIGNKGSNIKRIVGEPPAAQVDFGDDDDDDCIIVEGKPEQV